MNSWREVSHSTASSHQVLDCKWVYVYKVDKDGFLEKCKARLVVRGDQQADTLAEETYAATLAGKSFRTIMATAARFDLELTQYDVTNAFVNAPLPESATIYMRKAPGHRTGGTLLRLQKALYGLRQSPRLWQKHLSDTMKECGFTPVPEEACCFIKNGVLLFAYVDDLVLAYPKSKQTIADEAVGTLRSKYQLTGGDPLKWFLGIEIIRHRSSTGTDSRTGKGIIWLSQATYIDKLAAHLTADLIQKKAPTTPIREEEYLPYSENATPQSILRYQRKMGGALYAVIITRPDAAFAASRLSRFNSNPSPEHHHALDRLIHYLSSTRNYALQLGGADAVMPDLVVASDASFADNTIDRKSSQGVAISLFSGTVFWRANKQDTVTTSTTEAELLALSSAAKEGLFLQRLARAMDIDIGPTLKLLIQCDNLQTVRLITKDDAQLTTKLRHVDIHNHWLRQEAKNGSIDVVHVRTTEMLADGLTKALSPGKFIRFREQIGVIDITNRLTNTMPTKPDQALVDKMEELLV